MSTSSLPGMRATWVPARSVFAGAGICATAGFRLPPDEGLPRLSAADLSVVLGAYLRTPSSPPCSAEGLQRGALAAPLAVVRFLRMFSPAVRAEEMRPPLGRPARPCAGGTG